MSGHRVVLSPHQRGELDAYMYIRRTVNLWKSTTVKAHSHKFDPLRCTNQNHIFNITCFYTAGTQRVILFVFFIYCMSCMFSLSCGVAWIWFFQLMLVTTWTVTMKDSIQFSDWSVTTVVVLQKIIGDFPPYLRYSVQGQSSEVSLFRV